MDCRSFERLVQLNIDGLLSAGEREEMLQHAKACPPCAALLQDMTELAGLLTVRLSPVEPPAGFAQGVMAALPELPVKQEKRVRVSRPVWQRWGAVAAAALLLLTVGLSGLFSAPSDVPPLMDDPSTNIVAKTVPDPQLEDIPSAVTQPNDPPQTIDPIIEIVEPNESDEEVVIADPVEEAAPQKEETVVIETPSVIVAEEDVTPQEDGVDLPRPSTNPPPTNGMLSLTVLAAYDDGDAVWPSFNEEGQVEFFTKYKGKNDLWTQVLGAEDGPQHKEQVKSLPALVEIMGGIEESATAGFSYVSAESPDNRFIAVNCGGEQPGVWLYDSSLIAEKSAEEQLEAGLKISDLGGSKVLCWSPDSNKLLYTDSTGKLFVYHLFTKHSDALYGGTVDCASWAEDSRMVIFSGKMEKSQHSVIYTIIVP